jgi:hypothetical protein
MEKFSKEFVYLAMQKENVLLKNSLSLAQEKAKLKFIRYILLSTQGLREPCSIGFRA